MDTVPRVAGFPFPEARRYFPRALSVCRLGRFNATTLAAICVLPHESAMTSREATSLLPRSTADEANAISRSIADWLQVLAYGAIGWPWLLRSLSGGRRSDKMALLDRLQLPHDALPHLGSWKADTALLELIVDGIEELRPANVVELGSGASSLVIARALQAFGGGMLRSEEHTSELQSLM